MNTQKDQITGNLAAYDVGMSTAVMESSTPGRTIEPDKALPHPPSLAASRKEMLRCDRYLHSVKKKYVRGIYYPGLSLLLGFICG